MNKTDHSSGTETGSQDATPNRDKRREPTVIDAKAIESSESTVAEAETTPATEPVLDPVTETGSVASGEAATPAVKDAPARSSKLPLLVAILGGAVLAVGGAAAIHWYNDGDAAIEALAGQTKTLEERLAALDKRTASLADPAAIAALDTRLKAIEQRPAPAAAPAAAAAPAPAANVLAALEQRIAAAETAARNAQTGAEAARTAAAAAQQAAARPSAPNNGAAPSPSAAPAAPPPAAPPVDLGPVQDRISKVETRLAAIEAGLATPKVEARATETRVEPTLSTAGVAALGVVAQSLVRSLDRGAPFSAELAALKSLGVEQASLAPLEAVSAKGVQTPAALVAAFAPLAGPIAADNDGRNDNGVLDRLSRSASSLVRIRPVGEAAGDTPADIVARIEGALRRGDLPAALAAWNSLPEGAKKASAAWAGLLDARVKADRAALAIQADAIARLAQTKN